MNDLIGKKMYALGPEGEPVAEMTDGEMTEAIINEMSDPVHLKALEDTKRQSEGFSKAIRDGVRKSVPEFHKPPKGMESRWQIKPYGTGHAVHDMLKGGSTIGTQISGYYKTKKGARKFLKQYLRDRKNN